MLLPIRCVVPSRLRSEYLKYIIFRAKRPCKIFLRNSKRDLATETHVPNSLLHKILRSDKSEATSEEQSRNKKDIPCKENYKTSLREEQKENFMIKESQRIFNEAEVEMLPNWLYKQIFNNSNRSHPPKHRVELALKNLKNQAKPILDLAIQLADSNLPIIPYINNEWNFISGWTRYENGKKPTLVDFPNERILCLVTKTFAKENYPTIACAASPTAWYSWVSPRLVNVNNLKPGNLIPIGKLEDDRLIVGHNVGIDRTKIKEEYQFEETRNNFLDTMCLHVAVSGLCHRLRSDWVKYEKARQQKNEEYLLSAKKFQKIYDVSSMNKLEEVYKFHCGNKLEKSAYNIFKKGTVEDLRYKKIFFETMSNCALEVKTIQEVLKKVLPRFLDVCPHPVSFAGVIHMGNMFLTTNKEWEEYIYNSEYAYQYFNNSIESILENLANEALKNGYENAMKDPWLSQLDWSKGSKCINPKWYQNIYNYKTKKVKITASCNLAPILLKLKWMNYPLYYSKLHGWMYKVPVDDKNFRTKSVKCEFPKNPNILNYEPKFAEDIIGNYFAIPSKGSEGHRCGNPLAKRYMREYENGIISSEYSQAEMVFKMNAACTYWMSIRERIKSQLLIYPKEHGIENVDLELTDSKDLGIILPKALPIGTITRRVVENTWATATNAKDYLIGSEHKSMIKAPKGYKIIGADVDSQEMWISSLISDAEFGFHGSTGMGFMTLQGNKIDGTDLHSRTAQILNISRMEAKVFNYSRLYGAGIESVVEMLEKSNPNIDSEEAKERVSTFFKKTKGEKCHHRFICGRAFWFGGSETYMVNRLEEIALSAKPQTPVLKCGITDALTSRYAESNYMTSRINWVVQSSGVDYLHLLLVSMKYLIKKYKIRARFMLSVHDDIRYLVKEDDKYRAALALQISVDIDHVYRKETDMDCMTISHQHKIKPGKSVSIHDILNHQTSLNEDKQDANEDVGSDPIGIRMPKDKLWAPYKPSLTDAFIWAQSMTSFEEIEQLYHQIMESNKNKEKGFPKFQNINGYQNANRECQPQNTC
ncbi:7133_t:CDS:2 [Diversispora eburnea]|uniref:Mitochondrial DNA polymerase catalytic subunit n=1 Tax=Diversispora eburnea TaxID=1213867 RepID=A0A9N9BVQ9_9GLOM|nr:7133_t:CDS:2 [Diversispora eburnea]